jgi:sulfur-oxidizing protein SoxA
MWLHSVCFVISFIFNYIDVRFEGGTVSALRSLSGGHDSATNSDLPPGLFVSINGEAMNIPRKLKLLAFGACLAATTLPAIAEQYPKFDYMPGRELAIPHVSGDEKFSNTYQYWKDEKALEAAKKMGKTSAEMNYKDFRWAQKSFDAEGPIDLGKQYYNQKNANGKSCASCHGENGKKLVGIYANYPAFNKRLKRVVTVGTQIKTCAAERLGLDWPDDSRANVLTDFYLASLSDGKIIKIDATRPGPIKASFERGRDMFFKRAGHFNFACASCHTPPSAGKQLRGQRPTTFFGDAASYPIYHFPYALPGDDYEYVFTLQHQIKSCQLLSRIYPGTEGSPAMTDIEVFLKGVSNGYKMSIPGAEYNMDTSYLD